MSLTNTQVSKLRKAFANDSSANIKFSKTQLSKMIQSGGCLGSLLGPLLKTGLFLMKNVSKPLDKSVLIPLGLTAAESATDAALHKKIIGSGNTTLIISTDEMNHIPKIVKGFLVMLLGTLGASLLGNPLTGKGTIRADEGTIRAGENF